MKNTIVTAVYFSSPYSKMGGRGYVFEHYMAPFRNILNLDCNIVVYSHESEIKKIESFFQNYNFTDYKIIEFDLNDYKNSNKIYELKDSDNTINDRNHHLCLLKPFFLKHTIENNFFISENYYWVDAGLFHHGIFPETFGGIERFTKINEQNYWPNLKENVCNPNTINKLQLKNNSGFIFIGIDDYYGPTEWFNLFTESNKLTHIIGGLFGGKKEIVLELSQDFEKLTDLILNNNFLTLEEEVLSILYAEKYKKYNYISFNNWYHDIPNIPNYFGTSSKTKSFYKIFI